MFGKNAKYKRIMTGSPITKNPLDLYTQCEFLDPWLLDFSSYYAFRNRYAEMKTMHNTSGRSIQVVSKFQNLGELSDTVKPFSYRVLKEDCLDLPPKNLSNVIYITPEQKKFMKQMKKAAMAVLNGKVTTTMTVLTQLMRLHQITCGHFTADDGSVQEVESNRMKELMNVLEETEGKAIIWANYQRDIINTIVDEY